ncbi:MAG: chorismate synthase [Candidatus Omnitrophica bacterium]|nr:chorismate synthase [Candidatus Omnitrophota bacterium]
MRILTAGESHGEYVSTIIEGFPKGVRLEGGLIDQELKKRMSGAGRGQRMSIESDKVSIVSGLRNKITLGSPITMLVKNKDAHIFSQKSDKLTCLSVPRPAHADLAGALKYGEKDIRNILERASARETVARVCAGAACRQFLSSFGVKIAGFTMSVGSIESSKKPKSINEIIIKTKKSKVNSIDKEKLMLGEIANADKNKDSLGGIIEIWIDGLCPGLGSVMHFDQRLDGQLAQSLMSIPAIKGVEVGLGFEYGKRTGSTSHDEIYYNGKFSHKTNNSGGIEGGISNGEPIVLRIAMKPIATIRKPLLSVNLSSKKKAKAAVIRSDVCALTACAVIAEGMSATVIMQAFLNKFGEDSLKEIKTNYKNYIKTL